MWQIVNPRTQGVRSQKRRSQIYNEISLGENQAEKKQAYSLISVISKGVIICGNLFNPKYWQFVSTNLLISFDERFFFSLMAGRSWLAFIKAFKDLWSKQVFGFCRGVFLLLDTCGKILSPPEWRKEGEKFFIRQIV